MDVEAESSALSNAQIADRLAGLAQLLSTQKENPFKIKAYHRAAARIRALPESLDELVREDADLTRFPGIGHAIASAIREIVLTGSLRKLDAMRSEAIPEVASLADYPRLDPKRVLRIYKKFKISSVEALRERLESGEIERTFGLRMAQHVRQGLSEAPAMLLYRADDLRDAVEEFLLKRCGVRRVEVAGEFGRRVEVIEELDFVVDTSDFPGMVACLQRYGGQTPVIALGCDHVLLALSSGIQLRIQVATRTDWGLQMVICTGSGAHLEKLTAVTGPFPVFAKEEIPTEASFYGKFGLRYIEPELREGYDEVERAGMGTLPTLVTVSDIRGELHVHSTASDGSDSIEEIALAARERGYEYVGITGRCRASDVRIGSSHAPNWKCTN